MQVVRHYNVRIVTSGYTDRWLESTLSVRVAIGDPLVDGFCMEFRDEQMAIRYLQTTGISQESARSMVRESPEQIHLPWRNKNDSSGVSTRADVSAVERALKIISGMPIPAFTLSEEQFYAIRSGLDDCNIENSRMPVSLRMARQVIVSPPFFRISDAYIPDALAQMLETVPERSAYQATFLTASEAAFSIVNDTPAMADVLSGSVPRPRPYAGRWDRESMRQWFVSTPAGRRFGVPTDDDLSGNIRSLRRDPWPGTTRHIAAGLDWMLWKRDAVVVFNEDGTRWANVTHQLH